LFCDLRLTRSCLRSRGHYNPFNATTHDSAPVPRIGTLTLTGSPLECLPWHRDDRFPSSVSSPAGRSRHLYAGCRQTHVQVAV
jgi:hypothetical protein